MAASLLVLIVALYAAVATAYLEARRRREKPPSWARVLGAVAVVLHFGGLFWLALEQGRSPFSSGSQQLSFLAFSIAGVYLLLERVSRVSTHGGSFYALATLLVAVGIPGLVEAGAVDEDAARDSMRTWHIGLGLLSAAAVLVGGLLAVGYLGSYFRVKRHDLRQGTTGLSLSGFGRLTRNASFVSVLLLFGSLALGVALGTREDAPPGLLVLTGATAVVLLLLLVAWITWWRRPVRGAFAAWINVAGVAVMIVSLIVIHPLVVGGG